ncbi:protein SOSEKI 2 isoform X2 [Physcomitrium patens]|uniref:Protein SOSEKI 2 n=1 Tax=Physcomitrium patens TaxID=3218 RepID=SOK2_PHYPA|nr:uncharacterized protein LOC112293052 isoform X2 [Physcomitrium patens]A0A2K1L2D9.1 RecName: Full=Protein SOSEKI 2; Short=PpSOK2 [Physcomitrium patens]PNR60194.1 hypothetical protein PHYPA_002987 [Physcomitrium patens]|eukprot:XP_024397874.1 uncharacterized protein LOC112293052 isoform X2 [Physcomitrella patens]
MDSSSESYHKIEVIYLLSKGAEQDDHPHMIQVQYPSHQHAPTLRDVKFRLTALRGRGMPDSYSWSYKRSYKGTFIWCDVFDGDDILPLSESGEYVLKALEVMDSSEDACDRGVEHLGQEVARVLPTNRNGTSANFNEVHSIDDVRRVAPNKCVEVKRQFMGGSVHNNMTGKANRNEQGDAYGTTSRVPDPENCIENKRCLESMTGSDSSRSNISTDESYGLSFERDLKMDMKEMPACPATRSTDHGGMSSLAPRSSRLSRREYVKCKTWAVKEDENAALNHGRLSRRSSDTLRDSNSVGNTVDIPSSPVTRPCFPGDPLIFMLKKATKFHRSQLCRKAEVEGSPCATVGKPSSSRHTSKIRHGSGPLKAYHGPHSSKSATQNSRPVTYETSAKESERDIRSLCQFLGASNVGSVSQTINKEGTKKTGSARHIQAGSNDDFDFARHKEVAVDISEKLLLPEQVTGRYEKPSRMSKQLINKLDSKSLNMVTRPAVRLSSKLGSGQASESFSPASPHAPQRPIVSRPQEKAVNQLSLVAGFEDPQITSSDTSNAGLSCTSKASGLKAVKLPRNASNNCYFSLTIPDLEKRAADTKVYPWRENSAFNSIELYSGTLQKVDLAINTSFNGATLGELASGGC